MAEEKKLPEKFLEKYSELSQEELLDKLHDSEQANVRNKQSKKEVEKEYEWKMWDMQKQIDELSKSSKSSEIENFLSGKQLSDEEKITFNEKLEKGYLKEDAYNLATLESNKQTQNQENSEKNSLDWTDKPSWTWSITMSELSELAETDKKAYNSTMEQYDRWEIEVISE